MSHSLLIFGASVRAAACSALAGGELPRCADQFADRDLVERCCAAGTEAAAIENYPAGFVDVARAVGGSWMYTGALENHPQLVTRLMQFGTLLGCPPQAVARVRDPFRVEQVLRAAGLAVPEVQRNSAALPRDGSWLRKSRRSSAGAGVEVLCATSEHPPAAPGYYFQQRVLGQSAAAIFLAAGGSAVLLGATHQIFADPQGLPGEFHYVGSVGPLRLDGPRVDTLERLGRVLAAECGLCGLFGVDYIDDGQQIFPVEINPRYTASVEILERAGRFSAVQLHVAACREGILPAAPPAWMLPQVASEYGATACNAAAPYHAKQILAAPSDVVITEAFSEDAMQAHRALPASLTADVPWPATPIRAGAPVMTVFAAGETLEQALEALRSRAAYWQDCLRTLASSGRESGAVSG